MRPRRPIATSCSTYADETGPTLDRIRGGAYRWITEVGPDGNWNGATVTLQQLRLNGINWVDISKTNGESAALTEDGDIRVTIVQGATIRALVTGSPVDLNSVIAGAGGVGATVMDSAENHVGSVSPELQVINFAPTLDTAPYAGGDVLFETALTPNAMRKNDKLGKLVSVMALDEDDQTAYDLTLLFLDAVLTVGAVNTPMAIGDTAARSIFARVTIPAAAWFDLGGCKFAAVDNLSSIVKPLAGARTLAVAGYISGAGTPTHTVNGLRFRFGFELA